MTTRDFRLPDLGEGLEDAEVVRWLVAAGDVVALDQPLAEVLTAKATVELPSPFAGVVAALHFAAGDVVPVGAVLVSVDVTGVVGTASPAETDSGPAAPAAEPGSGSAEPAAGDAAVSGSGSVLVGYGTRPERRRRRPAAPPVSPDVATGPSTGPPTVSRAGPQMPPVSPAGSAGTPDRPAVMSPVVRRLARELGIELTAVNGSGPEGVITRGDVEAAAGAAESTHRNLAGPLLQIRPNGPANLANTDERIAIRGAHRQMAEHLARSRREIPEATVWVDIDATGLLRAKRLLDEANADRPTGTGIATWLAKFCILGLQRFPLLNSTIDGDEIVLSRTINLGFAAQTGSGLVVPVVHGADELSLLELDDAIRRLARSAREGTLTAGEVSGGTFTLNNYGVFGVDGSAAIINFPEVAIVGVGRIVDRPWACDGEVRVRPVTELTLSFDHRVCDGGVAGGFLRFVADCVEEPVRLLDL
jgi:pyruvate dehydrogenase E2 component (dihydrolipoamide acetyltransferase)